MQMHGSFIVNPDTSVGGVAGPVDKFGLLAPYLGSGIAILVAIAATLFYYRRRNSVE
jgi:nitrate reductase gamma subunit